MATRTINSFWNAIRDFFSSYKEASLYSYKLIKITKNDNDEHLLSIMVTNKNVVIDLKAINVVNDDVMLKGFSPYDIRTICYYAFTDQKSPQFRLISQLFTPDANGILTIKKRGEKKTFKKHVSDVIFNDEIIQSIPSKDAARVGYIKAKIEKLEDDQDKERLKLLNNTQKGKENG